MMLLALGAPIVLFASHALVWAIADYRATERTNRQWLDKEAREKVAAPFRRIA